MLVSEQFGSEAFKFLKAGTLCQHRLLKGFVLPDKHLNAG